MIAVDTNVLIYACDQADPPRQKIALDLITNAQDGVLLWQVACEFLSASRKLGKQGFTSTHAWNRLDEFRDLLPLVLPTDGNFARAKALHLTRGASLWDALIIAACVEAGVGTLYSETCLDSATSRASASSTHSSSRHKRGPKRGRCVRARLAP